MFEFRQILGATRLATRAPAGARVKRYALLSLSALALLAQAGCGQKGPLYLPDGQVSATPDQASATVKTRR